jgi:hypothetical protein
MAHFRPGILFFYLKLARHLSNDITMNMRIGGRGEREELGVVKVRKIVQS